MGTFKLATLSAVYEMKKLADAPAPQPYEGLDRAARQAWIDGEHMALRQELHGLNSVAGMLPPDELAAHRNKLIERHNHVSHARMIDAGENYRTFVDPHVTAGKAVPTPRDASMLNRYTGGLLGQGAVAGPAPAHGHETAELLHRELAGGHPSLPGGGAKPAGWWNRMGPVGKLGVGAAGVIGGGMLLKNLLGPSQPSPRDRQLMY